MQINFNEEERIPRRQKILDHVIATVNLFNNTPKVVKKDFRHPFFYVVFEAVDKRGYTRELSYNCFTEDMQAKTAVAIAEHYGIGVEEITD